MFFYSTSQQDSIRPNIETTNLSSIPSRYETLLQDLDTQSFHKMRLKCSRTDIETAVKAFFKFMELPEATKRRFAFKLEDYQGQMEIEY